MGPDIRAASGALLVLRYWCDAWPPPTPEQIRRVHEESMIADLNDADTPPGFRRDDVLIVNTLRRWPLRALPAWAETLGPGRAAAIALILHFTSFPSLDDSDETYRMYREALAAVERSQLRDRFILLADSKQLIAEYAGIMQLPVALAPTPQHAPSGDASRDTSDPHRPIAVAHVGEARQNKNWGQYPVRRVGGRWRPPSSPRISGRRSRRSCPSNHGSRAAAGRACRTALCWPGSVRDFANLAQEARAAAEAWRHFHRADSLLATVTERLTEGAR